MHQSKEAKEAAQAEFMSALAKLFSLGLSEQPERVALSVCQGLQKGRLQLCIQVAPIELKCFVMRAGCQDLQLFGMDSGYEQFGYPVADKEQEVLAG
jgi:hypothetical protein